MNATKARYLKVWVGLAALTGVEVLVAKAPWGRGTILASLVALGGWKALLIALEFMHLKAESVWLRTAAILPLFLSVIAVALILTDSPLLRGWM